jgi:hypothetical protein
VPRTPRRNLTCKTQSGPLNAVLSRSRADRLCSFSVNSHLLSGRSLLVACKPSPCGAGTLVRGDPCAVETPVLRGPIPLVLRGPAWTAAGSGNVSVVADNTRAISCDARVWLSADVCSCTVGHPNSSSSRVSGRERETAALSVASPRTASGRGTCRSYPVRCPI